MEKIKCSECEHENSRLLSFCSNCGARLPLAQPEEMEMDDGVEVKQRNGFVSFWLWFCIVINAIVDVMYFFSLFGGRGVMHGYEPMSDRIINFLLTSLLIVGYIGLLKWKKSGFYLIVGLQIISWIISLSFGSLNGLYLFAPFISIAVLFLILQIKKNGKSCWSQLK